jgi:2-oxoisovalerate dehydrogenase E1 component alpha subunit
VGKDFTLPYYRDLGVVLTIGMTPYEVFRTYLQAHPTQYVGEPSEHGREKPRAMLHWGYQKHNTVTGPAPIATQILHAAGIAFASKLRPAAVVTIAYCSDGATREPDFLEGIHFAAQHQLPIVFVCEHNHVQISTDALSAHSCINDVTGITLPATLTYQQCDGANIIAVHEAMQTAMQRAREKQGPTFLELHLQRFTPTLPTYSTHFTASNKADLAMITSAEQHDPLLRCQHMLQQVGQWNNEWAEQLSIRLSADVERAMHNALREVER